MADWAKLELAREVRDAERPPRVATFKAAELSVDSAAALLLAAEADLTHAKTQLVTVVQLVDDA